MNESRDFFFFFKGRVGGGVGFKAQQSRNSFALVQFTATKEHIDQ